MGKLVASYGIKDVGVILLGEATNKTSGQHVLRSKLHPSVRPPYFLGGVIAPEELNFWVGWARPSWPEAPIIWLVKARLCGRDTDPVQ